MPLMQVKSKSFAQYVAYEAHLQLQHGVKIKVVHSDRDDEFLSDDFKLHLKHCDASLTQHGLSVVYAGLNRQISLRSTSTFGRYTFSN